MFRGDDILGVFILYKLKVQPFTDKQIELDGTFAAQAVIAIENARLLNELRQRTADLSELLEQQKATSEVLQVISGAPGDLQTVFATILEQAVRICDAKFGILYLHEGDGLRLVAANDVPSVFAEVLGGRRSTGRMACLPIRSKRAGRLTDLTPQRRDLMPSVIQRGGCSRSRGHSHDGRGADAQGKRAFGSVLLFSVKKFVLSPISNRVGGELRRASGHRHRERATFQRAARKNPRGGETKRASGAACRRSGRRNRAHGSASAFFAPAGSRSDRRVWNRKAAGKPRREITALFCDLRGFTGFSESSDPEDVMALLREYHAAIGEIIINYSGTLERYAGDGVMVVFNDPVPVENPALQAVLMALEMRDAIGH